VRIIDKETLNSFLADSNIPYEAVDKLPASGQRDVYQSIGLSDSKQYIVKVAHYNKYNIGRVQREIKILNRINSPLFPKIIIDTFVARSILEQYIDNLFSAAKYLDENHNELKDEYLAKIKEYQDKPIRPFYLTVEEFIENISWSKFIDSTTELQKCIFIENCFSALDLLWENKIAHRDLKPDNILIRPNFSPVIIDLGIAKSFNDGTADLTPGFYKNPHTLRYASPEQLQDLKDEITYKSDQYSIGLIAYYLFCKKLPFGNIDDIGPDALIDNMVNFNYTPIATAGGQCCEEFENFIIKLIQTQPHQRYRTTKKIFQTLESIRGALQ
jgi:serine/threonine protein kinase